MTNPNQQLEVLGAAPDSVLSFVRMTLKVRFAGAMRRIRRAVKRKTDQIQKFHADLSGATTLEYAILLGMIGIPSFILIQMTLFYLFDYYRMMTAVNALPFP